MANHGRSWHGSPDQAFDCQALRQLVRLASLSASATLQQPVWWTLQFIRREKRGSHPSRIRFATEMFALCFTPGATAPLGQRLTSTGAGAKVCPRRGAPPNPSRRRTILCTEESSKTSPSDRPLPQGFGKSSSPSPSGEKLAFVGNDKIGISFTCDVEGCGERITKSVNRRSYEKGTVLIQCPKCEKHHIIADNMGMYAELTGGKKNVEEMAKDAGVAFARVNAEAFQLDNSYREAKNVDGKETESEPDSSSES